jgi:hypothetical protein
MIALAATALAVPATASLGRDTPDAEAAPPGRVTICHRTSAERNPYVVITVSRAALQTHLNHGDQLFVDGVCGGVGGS